MKITDECLLKRYRSRGYCEVCRKYCQQREGHHIFSRGTGRIDLAINLVCVGASRPKPRCYCHAQIEAGYWLGENVGVKEVQRRCLEIAAKREGVTVEEIIAEIQRIRNLPQPRTGEREEPIGKKRKPKNKWREIANERRRAAWRAAYQRQKAFRKAKAT